MDKLNKILNQIGLSKTEIDIYLHGLNHETIDVAKLVVLTNIKRTTIYHALNTLAQKGLAAKQESGGKMQFTMTEPNKLLKLVRREIENLKTQENELKEILPLLDIKKDKGDSAFQVFHYEGIDGIKMVVDEALYCQSRHWDIIAPPKNFFSEFDKEYAKYYLNKRKARQIKSRSIWEKDPKRRILDAEEIEERQPRYLPKEFYGRFKSVIILFDNKVAIISSYDELRAILIHSKEVKDTIQILFDGLWLASK